MKQTVIDDGVITLVSDRVIAYRPEIAKYFDDNAAVAIYFQQLSHWQQYASKPDGYFYKSAQELYEETSISPKRQRKCREVLEAENWITIDKRMANGHPTLHFKVLATMTSTIALGQKTNGIVQKDKSITKTTTLEYKYSSEIEKVYDIWLKLMVVDPDVRRSDDTELRRSALKAAANKTRLTDKRKTKIAARIESMGVERVIDAIMQICKSEFHRDGIQSDGSKGTFKADLEWLCANDERIEKWANLKGAN